MTRTHLALLCAGGGLVGYLLAGLAGIGTHHPAPAPCTTGPTVTEVTT